MTVLENLAAASVTIVALALALVAARSWWHTRNKKVLLLTVGFALFFVKGVIISIVLFNEPAWEQKVFLPSLLIDLGILAAFYVAVLTPTRR